ncbi:MAG: type II secretion system protein [Planctomycetes bacterium]|nr:type II secretion system protein [Planctomycetota bacterium]
MNVLPKPKRTKGTDGVFRRSTRRCGFTVTELVVAASLLVVVMSVVASLTVRSGRLWQDSRHYRLAIDELSNQLERLTSLDETRLAMAIAELSPSQQVRDALPNPVLSAETLADEDGTRLLLHLAWDRLGKSVPVTLVGWVDPLPSSAASAASEETP